MIRKACLPFFLAVMLVTVIVLAQATAFGNQGDKVRSTPAAPGDWITLLNGQTREFKAEADGTLHFPVTLNGVTPEQVSLQLRDVRLGQRGDVGLRDYFEVPDHIVQAPRQGSVIEVVMKLDKDPPQGTYDLLIEASTPAQPRPRDLELKVVHPLAKLKAADKVVLQTVRYPLWEPGVLKPSLILTEITGNSRVKPLKLVKPVFSGAQGEVAGGSLNFPDFPGQIPAGAALPIKYNLTGNFPLGSFTGNAQISAPQLAEPVAIQFEVKNRLGSWIIILLLVLGLAIGWLSRTYLTYQVELDKARLEGGRVLSQLTDQTARIPDGKFAEALGETKKELEAVLQETDSKRITDKAAEADQKLRAALKDFDERRAQVQAKLADFIKLFDTPWSLPPELQAIIAQYRGVLTDAQVKLANKDVEGSRRTLLGPGQPQDKTAEPGLEANLVAKLKEPVSDWKAATQVALESLGQPMLPAPIARSLREGVPVLNGLLAKVAEIQPLDQIVQLLAVAQAVSDVQTNLRVMLYLVHDRLEQTRRLFQDILSQVVSGNQAEALEKLTDEIEQFVMDFKGRITAPLQAIDLLKGGDKLSRLDANWQKFLENLVNGSSLSDDDKKALNNQRMSREYVDVARKFTELVMFPKQRAKLRLRMTAAGQAPGEVSPWMWLQQTLFPAAGPLLPLREEPPPALASFLTRTRWQLFKSKFAQTMIFGSLIVLLGYLYFQDKFVGTPLEMATIFFWGYGLDVSAGTVLETIKSSKLHTP